MMKKDYIEETTKNISREDLIKSWRACVNEEKASRTITEFFHDGFSMRTDNRGKVKTTFHDKHSEKNRILKFLDFICLDANSKRELIGTNVRHNVSVYSIEKSLINHHLSGEIITSDYLLPRTDTQIKENADLTAIIEHNFTAVLIDLETGGLQKFYVGNVYDFSMRILKRGYAM